jgi:hypothetical protein
MIVVAKPSTWFVYEILLLNSQKYLEGRKKVLTFAIGEKTCAA